MKYDLPYRGGLTGGRSMNTQHQRLVKKNAPGFLGSRPQAYSNEPRSNENGEEFHGDYDD